VLVLIYFCQLFLEQMSLGTRGGKLISFLCELLNDSTLYTGSSQMICFPCNLLYVFLILLKLHWRVYLAGINGDSVGRTKVATLFGGPKWRLFLADQIGGSFWAVQFWRLRRAGQFGKSIQRFLLKRKQG
jgi:hypothetical protein